MWNALSHPVASGRAAAGYLYDSYAAGRAAVSEFTAGGVRATAQRSLQFAKDEILPRFNPRNYRRSGWDVDFVRNSPGFQNEFLAKVGKSIEASPKTYEEAYDTELWLNNVAQKYKINMQGSGEQILIKYDTTLAEEGVTRWQEGGNVIRIGPIGATDEATAANTIAHELSHGREYIKARKAGITEWKDALKTFKPHGGAESLADGTPYGSGNALEDFIRGNR